MDDIFYTCAWNKKNAKGNRCFSTPEPTQQPTQQPIQEAPDH